MMRPTDQSSDERLAEPLASDDSLRPLAAALLRETPLQAGLAAGLALLLALCLHGFYPGDAPWAWCLAVLALQGVRAAAAWLAERRDTPPDANLVLKASAFGLLATALPWAALPLLAFSRFDPPGHGLALLAMAAATLAATPWQERLRHAAYAHAALCLVPGSLWILLSGLGAERLVGVGGLACLGLACAGVRMSGPHGRQLLRVLREAQRLVASEARSARQLERVVLQLGEAQKALLTHKAMLVNPQADAHAAAIEKRSRDLEQRTLELARQAVTDPLTGLPNRKGINEHLSELLGAHDHIAPVLAHELGQEPTLALLFLDLDHFKEVNDLMGHLAGDSVLKVVAERLRENMPRGAFAARWGGDEFVVLLPGTRRADQAKRVAEHLRVALSVPVQLEERVARIGCCVGIALAPQHGSTPEALIIAADHAVYAAKAEGSGKVRLFDARLAEAAERQHEIAQALPEAVELGQLSVAYQPIVSAEDGEATHVEALSRWRHPHWGAVSPAEFIPVAEASGLIHTIGRWVLRQACTDAARWPGANPPKVSVNVSAMQVTGGRLLAQVREALATSHLPASRLVIELTESLPMAGRDGVDATLKELRNLGVTLAIDDFGTGYSSMVSLKNQPLSLIKVDRSFVQDVPGEGELLIKATVDVARCFGLKVVAEGVETRAQQLRLRALGVDYMQGYLFGRPMPNNEFVAWLALRDTSLPSVALRDTSNVTLALRA